MGSCAGKLTMFPLNTNILFLQGLTFPQINDDGSITQIDVSDATVLATLYDGEGNEVSGCVAIALSSVGSPPIGDYSGTVDGDGFDPEPGGDYILTVTGTEGPGRLHIDYEVEIVDRRS